MPGAGAGADAGAGAMAGAMGGAMGGTGAGAGAGAETLPRPTCEVVALQSVKAKVAGWRLVAKLKKLM